MRTSVFTFSDGYTIPYYEWTATKKAKAVVLGIHGITTDLDQWRILASNLAEALAIDVHVPVLRGYKPNEKHKGHIENMEQYDVDLTEMINELKQEYNQVILLGHSAGCGNVLRGLYLQDLNVGALLLSPFIHPEMNVFRSRENAGDGDDGGYKLFQMRTVIAHTLSKLGIKIAESLPVVQVPLREKPMFRDSAVFQYRLSYRLMMGRFLNPDLAVGYIQKQKIPIIIGEEDEVIDAGKLAHALSLSGQKIVQRIQGADHNSVFHHQDSLSRIIDEIRAMMNISN
ncbi:alpha/beta hydrolase [Salisediminibacterium selenitireducens]|uniref:Lysophospholipase-like protein n=1 Tax=Bacillus selenitireducens (strain ATCC 700615 / DSM 15326 / MLS10) TaxID=439292 RepID=D6XU87_BACIE|nr:alpha/beta hydrolase [Salisediminibacterium selenitireducens]ADH99373.1 Lysophospholipase-like protein [[Bacillus] selenitireducens MLS10]